MSFTPEQLQSAAADMHRERFGEESADSVLRRPPGTGLRALVTGDQGFIGRHFRTELEARGYEVAGLDIKEGPAPQDCRTFFQYWLQRPEAETHWDLVVHAAAVVGGRETIDGDPLATAENLSIDADMFRWAARAKPGRVIYFSSSAVYPVSLQTVYGVHNTFSVDVLREDFQDVTKRENWVGQPDQVYGWSKVIGEVLAGKLREAGVPVTVVRPFSGYGADQDESYPFRAFLERALRREDPFEMWCGSCVRDFVHVEDIVQGTLALADADVTEPVNICTGVASDFHALLNAFAIQLPGYAPAVKELSDKPSGVAYRVGDPTRLAQHYTPKVTLAEGVRRALEERG